jgi:hypothetical protein
MRSARLTAASEPFTRAARCLIRLGCPQVGWQTYLVGNPALGV